MKRDPVYTRKAPEAIGPYSQGIKTGNLIFLSMQVGIDSSSGQLAGGGIMNQTRQILHNIEAILEHAGSHLNQVVKSTIFLKDLKYFKSFNDLYAQYFDSPYPARSVVEVSELPLSAEIAIEIIAVV